MMTDYTTTIQYSGYFQPVIRQILELGRANPNNEELRVQRRLAEESRKVLNIAEGKGKLVDRLI